MALFAAEESIGFALFVGQASPVRVCRPLGRTARRLRRGAYGTPIGSHATGSAFGLALGAFIHEYPSNLIGQTLYFKFTSFNSIGAQPQDLASVSLSYNWRTPWRLPQPADPATRPRPWIKGVRLLIQ
jgi:hypothetical protein